MNPVSRRVGLMLVGHGTRDDVGTRQFFELAEVLAAIVAPRHVASALLEFQSPTIDQAWSQLAEAGVMHINVAPLLLFSAGHAKQDIPEIIARCQQRTPAVSWSQSRALSRHPTLLELAIQRGRDAIEKCESPPSQRAWVLVGRGSRDPCAQADTRLLGHLVGHRLDVARVMTAFYAMANPNVPAVLEELATCGRYRDVIVQPHLIFAGRLNEAIVKQVHDAELRHPHVRFHIADYLGPVLAIAQAIVSRHNAALNLALKEQTQLRHQAICIASKSAG